VKGEKEQPKRDLLERIFEFVLLVAQQRKKTAA
jgi:hypothetical protein